MSKRHAGISVVSMRDIIGWYGVLVIVVAYVLLSFKTLHAATLPYQLRNLTGAIAILYEAATKKDMEPVALNLSGHSWRLWLSSEFRFLVQYAYEYARLQRCRIEARLNGGQAGSKH